MYLYPWDIIIIIHALATRIFYQELSFFLSFFCLFLSLSRGLYADRFFFFFANISEVHSLGKFAAGKCNREQQIFS